MNDRVLNIIKQILKSAKENDILSPTKTRLIKLLYLIEIEYYRHNLKRLTDLKWKFYHYGPYPTEIESILGSPDIETMPFASKDNKSGNQYNLAEDSEQDYVLPEIGRIVNYVVKEWGETDLNKLLDYVYFDTEPMKDAKRGGLLDFNKVSHWQPPEKVKDIRIDRKKIAKLKSNYSKHFKELKNVAPKYNIPDKAYYDCIAIWDDEISDAEPTGKVIVQLQKQDNL